MSSFTDPWTITTITDVTASRSLGTTYTNNTGRTMFCSVSVRHVAAIVGDDPYISVSVPFGTAIARNGIGLAGGALTTYTTTTFLVPPSSTYRVDDSIVSGGINTLQSWIEAQ